MRIALATGLAITFLSLSCNDKPTLFGSTEIRIKVIDETFRPVAGAHLRGGFDWDEFDATTDGHGVAWLPIRALDYEVTISKDDFFSRRIQDIGAGTYSILRTPLRLAEMGEIKGEASVSAVRFWEGRVATVGYGGDYHLYEISDAGLNELATAELQDLVRSFSLSGDTLWYITHDSGLFVYSLENPYSPQQLRHYEISSYLFRFARKDTLVAVAYDNLRLYYCLPGGETQFLASLDIRGIDELLFISHYLIAVGEHFSAFIKIFDISDPANLMLVHDLSYGEYDRIFVEGDTAVLGSWAPNEISNLYDYSMIDLSDPASPHTANSFTADGMLYQITDDTVATGSYTFGGYAVFRRGAGSDFRAVAIRSSSWYDREFGGASPPYFIIGWSLFRLIPR